MELCEYGSPRTLKEVKEQFFAYRNDLHENQPSDYHLLVTFREIQHAIKYIASELNRRFKGENVVMVGILKGSYVFMTDLTRQLSVPYSVYFLEASSYSESKDDAAKAGKDGDGDHVHRTVRLHSQIVPEKLNGRKVVLLDELFDNGSTMEKLSRVLLEHPDLTIKKEDLFTCTLFLKEKETPFARPDLVGLSLIPDVWLIGYGLDDAGEKRGWAHLFAVSSGSPVPLSKDEEALFHTPTSLDTYRTIRKRIVERLGELQLLHGVIEVL